MDAQPHGLLFVEGKDDRHALIHLLARHAIILDESDGPVLIKPKGSDSQVIDSITVAVKSSGKHPVGFVVDSDTTVERRWLQIRAKLAAVDVELPLPTAGWAEEIPSDGFVAESHRFERRVGVWIMPNNRTDYGKIEDMLHTLVPVNDDLFPLAERSTREAIAISARRPVGSIAICARDEAKGKLHSWLAWQEEPGLSFGHALRRKYFACESPVANLFVAWFKRLYALS